MKIFHVNLSATREFAAVNALSAAYLLHTIINNCQRKGLCPKCEIRSERVPEDAKRKKGEEKLTKIIHQSDACDEMFKEPMAFVRRFLKYSGRRMRDLSKQRQAEEKINFHNRLVGIQVKNY